MGILNYRGLRNRGSFERGRMRDPSAFFVEEAKLSDWYRPWGLIEAESFKKCPDLRLLLNTWHKVANGLRAFERIFTKQHSALLYMK